VIADGVDVIFPHVISPDFALAFPGKMCGEKAADGSATDDTYLQQT
jgi:hypothetical protein